MAKYSDIDKARALVSIDAHGGNVSEARKHLKLQGLTVSDTTLRKWNQGESISEFAIALRMEFSETVRAKIDVLADMLFNSLIKLAPDATFGQTMEMLRYLSEMRGNISPEAGGSNQQAPNLLIQFQQSFIDLRTGSDGYHSGEPDAPRPSSLPPAKRRRKSD